MLRRPKHGYYFVLESAGQWQEREENLRKQRFSVRQHRGCPGLPRARSLCLKFFPKIVNTTEDTVPYGIKISILWNSVSRRSPAQTPTYGANRRGICFSVAVWSKRFWVGVLRSDFRVELLDWRFAVNLLVALFFWVAQRFSAAINAAKAMTALAAEVPDGIHFEVPAQTPLPF